MIASHEAWKAPGFGPPLLHDADSPLIIDYLDTIRRKSHLEPEKELMLAVLEQAIDCFRINIFQRTKKQQELYREVESWILDENQRWLYSFDIICETLDISPTYLRARLILWKRKHLTRMQSLKN